jgi:hypothetical protein
MTVHLGGWPGGAAAVKLCRGSSLALEGQMGRATTSELEVTTVSATLAWLANNTMTGRGRTGVVELTTRKKAIRGVQKITYAQMTIPPMRFSLVVVGSVAVGDGRSGT